MTKKITKRDFYKAIAEMVNKDMDFRMEIGEKGAITAPMIQEFIAHEVELLDRKNASKSGAKTAQQKANDNIRKQIVDLMTPNTVYRAMDICREMREKGQGDFNTQKVTSLMKNLVEDEIVRRFTEKRVTYYELV